MVANHCSLVVAMRKQVFMHCLCAKMHGMNPDWEDMKTVLHLARTESLSKAATSLGVNYTTVARRISRIEKSLGRQLFQRLPSGYLATEEGQDVAEAAKSMETHMDGLLRRQSAAKENLSGVLRITAPQLLVGSHLAHVLRLLHSKHPEIEPEVLATNELLDLNRPEADVAIRISNDPGDALVGQRLTRQHNASFATRKIAKKLDSDPNLLIEWIGMPHWKSPPKPSLKQYPNARIAYRFDDMTAILGATVAGLGVARLPLFLGESTRGLVRIPVLSPQPYWDIWVLTHKDMRNAPKVAAFKNLLIPYFKEHQSDFWQE